MRLRGTQYKLEAILYRHHKAVEELAVMNRKYEAASQKLKEQLALYCTESEEKMYNLSSATNDLPDTYEDNLLDDEFLECVPDMNSVPSKGHSMGYSSWCTSTKLVSESEVVKKSSSLDKMTVDEVIMAVPKVDGISPIAANPLTGVFNFKTKPRGRRCTDKSVTSSLRFPGQKCYDSVAVSNGMTLPTFSLRQCHRDGLRPRVLVHGSGKNISDVGLTRAPIGPPLDEQSTMEKGHESEDSTDSVSPGSDMKFDTELYSLRAKTHKRKRHIQWSLEEVIQLVDGVSKYGVGRWSDIKRVFFSSSAHRSSVDLKDKWRNLLRATCRYFESKKRGGQRKFIMTQFLPKDILHRVRELSLIYPYPRERNSKVS